jgi:hypothetical protein
MAPLNFSMEPSFECADDDSRDLAFVCVAGVIGGRDAVEEYLACKMFPLSASFGFEQVVDGESPVSKVTMPLPEFPLTNLQGESDAHFLVRVELDTKNVLGSYGCAEHDACIQALPNGGRLNRVFEKVGVAYGPYPEPGTEASMKAARKRKVDAGKKKLAAPKAAAAPKGTIAASSMTISTPLKVALKAGAPSKAAAPKATAAKVGSHAVCDIPPSSKDG